MLHVRFDVFCVFYTSILFALMLPCQGQSAVTGPIQPIVATVGDDIILPCYLYPTMDASDMTVEWTRPDLESRLVHVRPERAELQNPSYKGRTSLFTGELKHGEISLKISKVKLTDEGTYKCFVPDLRKDFAVRLVVGAASSPVVKMNRTTSKVVLQCESAGWYPEPELLWLDGEGNLLSAGPSETLRGPDDLYTVSSRVTVEKRHSNNITCRVQQKNINQSRETHIHVPDDFFMVISLSSPPNDPTIDSNTITGLAIGAVVVLVLILAVCCVVWKRRRVKCRNKKRSEEDGPEWIRKEKMINSKNDHREFHVVVEEGESEPLMAGREEEDDVESRGEQSHEDERETKDHQEELKEGLRRSEEERMNPFILTEKASQSAARREKNQRKQSESRMEGEKDETEVKNQHHKEENTEERREEEPENEKHGEGNQRDRTGMTERKTEEQRGQEESRNSSVSSKVTLNTDLTTQEKRRGQNQETQAEETSEIREQPEKQRRAQSEGGGQREMMEVNEGVTADGANRKEKEKLQLTHEGALQAEQQENVNQKEEPEEPVSVTERGVDCLEESQKQELRDEAPDVDLNNVQRGKNTQEIKLHEVCEQSVKKEKIQEEGGARKHQNVEVVRKFVKKQNDDHLEVDDAAHSQSAAITQQHETIKWTKEQQMLSEQKDTQEYLREHEEDPIEVEEHSGLQFPPFTQEHKEQPVLLAGAENFSFTFHLNTDQEPWREKETEQAETQRRAQSEGGGQGEMMEVNEGLTADGTNWKKTGEKRKQEINVHEDCEQSAKKPKIQEVGGARKHQNVKKVKKFVKKQKDDHMEADDAAHSQSAAITQQHETIKWTKEQQMLSEQKDTQEYLTEHEEDQMEVEERSGLQFPPFTEEPKEQPVLLAGAKSFSFSLLLHSDQETQREKRESTLGKKGKQSGKNRKLLNVEKKSRTDGGKTNLFL